MYGKHFQSTYTGSMVGSGPTVFAVWGYVIANTRDSMVELNPVILATILGCKVEEIDAAIDLLCSEDEKSRSKEEDGRRLIKKTEYSYFVPTYEKYRNIRNENERREYMRNYMRKYRDKEQGVTDVKVNSKPCKPQLAHSDTDSNSDTKDNIGDISPTESKLSATPYQKIVDLYHETLPELPKVAKLTKTRKGYIQQRWKEDMPELKNWGNFFDYVKQSDFLTGKTNGSGDRPPFRADLEWLIKPSNFVKIAEGKYHV